MAFTVEDGSGLANANAFCDTTVVDAYWADRGGNAAWTALATLSAKQARVILATDFLRTHPRYRWLGTKKTATQRLPWPRTGVTERDGDAIADDIVPQLVIDAVCILCPILTSLEQYLPSLERGGQLTSKSIAGVISKTWAAGAPTDTRIQYLDGLLSSLLRTSALDDPMTLDGGVMPMADVFGADFDAPYSDSAATPDA